MIFKSLDFLVFLNSIKIFQSSPYNLLNVVDDKALDYLGARMNKDDFKQTLIKQYSEVIEEIIVESESVYRSHIDYTELDFRVRNLIQAARVDGLDESVIWDMLEHRVPDYINYLTGQMKIAA